jgi:hypothetical protein
VAAYENPPPAVQPASLERSDLCANRARKNAASDESAKQ